jgi:hypothetical protein
MVFTGLVKSFAGDATFYLEILLNANAVSDKLARRCVLIAECMLLADTKACIPCKIRGGGGLSMIFTLLYQMYRNLKNKHKLLFTKKHGFQLLFEVLLYFKTLS